MEIVKMRGLAYRQGYHDYTVGLDGFVAYPRLVAGEHESDVAEQQHLSSGVATLDSMLGGGVNRGSTTLILGATGVGKSLMAMQYAFTAATQGERAVIYSFDEAVRTAKERARGFGMQIDKEITKGHLHLEQVNPAELSPGEFINRIRREVEERQAKVICIDSLNGLRHSMPGELDLVLQLHELVVYLAHKSVATFFVLTQHGVLGNVYEDLEISYLADSVVLIRYFEAEASIRRAISILKKRSGPHEHAIRELHIGPTGIHVGEQLASFKGILSGMPDSEQELPKSGEL
jgi:circadian clock protein KaiC